MTASRTSGAAAGIALYSVGVFFFACNDAIGKWLVGAYGAGELMAMRTLGALAVLGILQWRARAGLRLRGSAGLHALRILCSAGDTFAFYASTKVLQLADVMTFYAASPVIIVALSVLVLGERLSAGRLVAVGMGFVGVVIALHPTAGAVSPAALLALGGSALFASAVTITRRLRDTHWLTLVAYQFVGSGAIGALAALPTWITPDPRDFGLLLLIGVVAVGCFIAITKALAVTAASRLAPLQYASVVWAAMFGWLVWRDVPSTATLVGVAVIVASGLVVLRPERAAVAREAEVA